MKMKNYKLRLAGGHLLVNDDRGTTLLLDTGSPLSFHSDGIIALGNDTFNVGTSLMGTDSGYVTDNVGTNVDGLVGTDILGRCGVLFDVQGGQVILGHPTDGMTRVPSHSLLGYIFVDMGIRGHDAKVILDTGAPISYVSPSVTEGLAAVDTVTDFHPTMGSFETPIFEFPASFAGRSFEMRAGHLPSIDEGGIGIGNMGTILSFFGIDGIVGMELLKHQPLLMADGGVWV